MAITCGATKSAAQPRGGRDAAHVRMWDPRHPTYVGTRNARGLNALTGVDLVGYYDFHWQRGGHFRHLARALEAAQMHDARLLEYCQGDPGLVGKGNYNRVLYTISTSLAFGLKGYLFHYTGGEIDPQSWKWQPLGEDLARVNAETAPLGPEVLRLGNPTAVYSTPVTRTGKGRPPRRRQADAAPGTDGDPRRFLAANRRRRIAVRRLSGRSESRRADFCQPQRLSAPGHAAAFRHAGQAGREIRPPGGEVGRAITHRRPRNVRPAAGSGRVSAGEEAIALSGLILLRNTHGRGSLCCVAHRIRCPTADHRRNNGRREDCRCLD